MLSLMEKLITTTMGGLKVVQLKEEMKMLLINSTINKMVWMRMTTKRNIKLKSLCLFSSTIIQ